MELNTLELSNLRVKTLREIAEEFTYSEDSGWRTKYIHFVEGMVPYCGKQIPISEALYKLMLGLDNMATLFPNSGYFFDISMITNIDGRT